MRCRTTLTLLPLLLAAGAPAQEDGLVAHYPFDEGEGTVARDAGGHGLDGVIHGAEYVQLPQGYALRFDGVDDYVEIPDSERLRFSGPLTVSCWINTPVNSSQAVLAKNGCSILRQNYRLGLEQNRVNFGVTDCPEGRTASGPGPGQQTWAHLAGTFNDGEVRVYVNGQLRGTHDSDPFEAGTLEAPLYVGTRFYGLGPGGFFTGQIDDLRLYGRTLSEAEIAAQYEAGKELRISVLDRLKAQISPVSEEDTTPPALVLPRPAPDSMVDGAPAISAGFREDGSGIDPASIRILLDGEDVTSRAEITGDGFRYAAGTLADGIHQVDVSLSDRAGNTGNRLRWRFGVNAPVPVESRFDGEVFRVNGEPFFPVGIYSSNVSPASHMPYIAQAAEAGINYKLIGEASTRTLDDLLALGMKGLVHFYYASLALGRGDAGRLTDLVERAKDHPANLGWWNEYASENQAGLAAETYRFIRERDPNHPVSFMLNWGGALGDAYFVYAYPILNPLLPDDSITSINELILDPAFESAGPEGKQVWFVSQAFDYRLDSNRGRIVTLEGGFRPSREEIRAMNYLALTRGVKGLAFYAAGGEIPGTRYTNDVAIYPRQWTEVLKLSGEIRYLAPALAAGSEVQSVELEQEGEAIHFIERLHDGVHTLIAVNVKPDLALGTWRFDRPVRPQVMFEDRVASTESRGFTDLFRPLEVHVYQWPEARD